MADPLGDVFDKVCAGRTVLEHLTGRWSPLIMAALCDGPMRFSELRARIGGISEKMLSQTLRILVRDGFVARTVEPTVPPRVSYALTELGRDLASPLQHLIDRIAVRVKDVLRAQEAYDRSAQSSTADGAEPAIDG